MQTSRKGPLYDVVGPGHSTGTLGKRAVPDLRRAGHPLTEGGHICNAQQNHTKPWAGHLQDELRHSRCTLATRSSRTVLALEGTLVKKRKEGNFDLGCLCRWTNQRPGWPSQPVCMSQMRSPWEDERTCLDSALHIRKSY